MTTNTIPETQQDQDQGKRLNEIYQSLHNTQSTLKLISERLMESEDSYEESQAISGVELQLSAIADQLEQEIHRVEKDNGSG